MKTSFLASMFDRMREVVEAAETPFAKLAIFILPILAPIVPASFTAMHIYNLLTQQFEFANWLCGTLATIVGITLELLGYVGALEFIHSIWQLVKSAAKEEYWIPVVMTGFAYIFYLIVMYFINVQLGVYFQSPVIVNRIVGLLSFITVPTSLLAGNHLAKKADGEKEYVLRQEKREDSMKSKMIKAGMNPMGFAAMADQVQAPKAKEKGAADYRAFVFELLTQHNGELTPRQITDAVNKTKRVNLEHDKVKSSWTRYTQEWRSGVRE